MLIKILGLTLAAALASPPQNKPKECTAEDLGGLYQIVLHSICAINYAWSLVGQEVWADNKDIQTCFASFVAVGVAGAHGVALSLRSELKGSPHTNYTVLNSKEMRELYQRSARRFLNNYPDRVILEALEKHPKHHIQVRHGVWVTATKGPHKLAFAAGEAAKRLSYLAASLGLVGAALTGVDLVFSSAAAGCAEPKHRYYSANPEDQCRPLPVIGPEVMNFLSLSETDQNKVLKQHPGLCAIYGDLASSVRKTLADHFDAEVSSPDCRPEGWSGTVRFADRAETEVVLRGRSATIKRAANTYQVEYARSDAGKVFLKNVVVENSVSEGGAVGAPYRYRFPPGEKEVITPRFQQTLAELARVTAVLENQGAFDRQCARGASPTGVEGAR